jgi:tRNA(adenine34) deaminase
MEEDKFYMQAALEEAKAAAARDEVPIGAVAVHRKTGEITARAGNRTRELNDPTAHAEVLVIRAVCKAEGAQRIPDYNLYVTLEPCTQCACAISFARFGRVVFGAADLKGGAVTSGVQFYSSPTCHHKPDVTHGVLEDECSTILKEFFRSKRH